MSFIQRLKTLHKSFKQGAISDELWLQLLESGASSQELQWYFGSTESLENRLHRLSNSERRQYALYESHLSSRMALWWVLKQRHDLLTLRKKMWQTLAYPMLLFGVAFIMILLLNHLMIPRLATLFDLSGTSSSTGSSFQGLMIVEVIYLGVILFSVFVIVIPASLRLSLILRFYQHPTLQDYRFLLNTRFVHWMIKGLEQGLSVQSLLHVIAHGNDPILCYWSNRVYSELEGGCSLADALEQFDPRLKLLLMIQDQEQTIDHRLRHHYSLMIYRVDSILQRWRAFGLTWGYLSFGIIIYTAYQVMLEPIRQLEQLL